MRKAHRLDSRIKRISPSFWRLITQIDEVKGRWVAGARLSPQILGRLKRSVLVTSTGSSTRIEGARLSDADIEKLMRGLDIQKFQDRDKQECKGYYQLLENVFNAWDRLSLTEGNIKFFHKEMLKFVDKDKQHRGKYKQRENKVHMIDAAGQSVGILFDTTPAYLTPKEMLELVEWTSLALKSGHHHPLLVIANFLVEFLKIHPFQDGNGRLSRVLTNLLLLKTGYSYVPYVSHEKIIEDNKPDYYLALRQSQKTFKTKRENLTPWLKFFLQTILKQSQMAVELLSEDNLDVLLTEKQRAVWAFMQKKKEATPQDIAKATNIPRPTINQILTKLLQLKKIQRLGQGRGTRYVVLVGAKK